MQHSRQEIEAMSGDEDEIIDAVIEVAEAELNFLKNAQNKREQKPIIKKQKLDRTEDNEELSELFDALQRRAKKYGTDIRKMRDILAEE
ncbi:MAG: hypothetical protein EZS28_021440 [Streblomastix strix]|uniref:Uncharacterized protein n=1 Tax=Streblomastix strix TaxID=222440 RepID=A0A5J4VKN6_9EUKA|nr:MAG: hypothetical protein EZS28_021440 [Streblomastix strix]